MSCKLQRCQIYQCEAACCYDGVYLDEEEELILEFLVEKFPEDFSQLPSEFVVNGYWQGEFYGRKTATRPHSYSDRFPEHFNQTRCVFADDRGFCSMESLARRLELHPWTFKPNTCWIHPAELTASGLQSPPLEQKDDPYRTGVDYPGYVTFTSCGRNSSEGIDWREALSEERQYYRAMESEDNLGKTLERIAGIVSKIRP